MAYHLHARTPSMFELATLNAKVRRWQGGDIYMVLYTNDGTRMAPRIKASVKTFQDDYTGWMMLDIKPDMGQPSGVTWHKPAADMITFDLALEREDGTQLLRGPCECNTPVMTPGSTISPTMRYPAALIEDHLVPLRKAVIK